MLRLSANVQVGDWQLAGLTSASIRSSWATLTDTATVRFPRAVRWRGRSLASGSDPLLRRGQQIDLALGYDGQNDVAFSGYVREISAELPVRVECDDAAWLLKQNTQTHSFRSVGLRELLTSIIPSEVSFECPDVSLGTLRLSNVTPAQVLADLKKRYLLKSWLRGGKLYVGFAYVPSIQQTHILRFERNVVGQALEYRRREDVLIKLKVVSVRPDNSREEVEVGDPAGEQRTVHLYDVPKADLKRIAEEELDRLRYSGYRGKLTTFLLPAVRHGDVVDLRSSEYPGRDGRYLVRAVDTEFGPGGGRQTIELDSQL